MITSEQRKTILKLDKEGLSGRQIAREVGVHDTTVHRLLRRVHGRRRPETNIHLVYDPNELFSGRDLGHFGVLDLVFGVLDEVWAEGSIFDINGRRAWIHDGHLIRDDGKHLKGWRGGGYRWINHNEEEI